MFVFRESLGLQSSMGRSTDSWLCHLLHEHQDPQLEVVFETAQKMLVNLIQYQIEAVRTDLGSDLQLWALAKVPT